MTDSRRALRQAVPLAALILGLGLAQQYASGGGVFEAESGLMAKTQAIFAELRELSSAASEVADLGEVDAVPVIASEATVAAPALPPSPRDVRVRSANFSFSGGQRLSSCQH